MTSRNRLSTRSRKKVQTSPANADVQRQQLDRNVKSVDATGGDMMEGFVPWTEKYRPRCSGEVVGNSVAVKKLYR